MTHDVKLEKKGNGSMTCQEAKDMLDAKIKQYVKKNNCNPKLIHLPVLIAHTLSKCKRHELGSLVGAIYTDGIVAFEQLGYFGHSVKLELEEETEIIID